MNEFKQFIKVIAFVIVCGVTIAASSGSINLGVETHEGFNIVVGILNFGWLYFPIREAVKYFKSRTAAKEAAKAGVSEQKADEDNKTDSAKQ
jgi:hypothetical protein